jgi:hypothetical protein
MGGTSAGDLLSLLCLGSWEVFTSTERGALVPNVTYMRKTFVHEFTHYLDHLRYGVPLKMRKRPARVGGDEHGAGYFLSPAEFNAYYQEGFASFLDDWAHLLARRPVLEAQGSRMTPAGLQAAIRRFPKLGEAVWEKFAIDMEQFLDWDKVRFKLEEWWSSGFIHFVRRDPAMKRRFLKRLRVNHEAWRTEQLAWLNPLWQVVKDADQA